MGDGDPAAFTLKTPRNRLAAARSRVYGLLAEGLSYPEGSVALRQLDGDWRGDIADALAELPHAVSPDDDSAVSGDLSVPLLKSRYSTLFDVSSGAPAISLLERRYVDTPEQQLWEQLLRYYGHFGLDFSRGTAAEQPDHLLTELSFMHYLAYLEAGAGTGAAAFLRGQRDFLARHLEALAAGVAERAAATPDTGIYGTTIALARGFVAADAAYCRDITARASDSS